jgi:tungstate transport system permease protein
VGDLVEAFVLGLKLIFSGDAEVYEVAGRTLVISCASTAISMVIFVPLGSVIFYSTFPGKGLLVTVIRTLYSMPTVFVGLLVFIILSRTGPLGGLGILFTPTAIVIGEVILIAPIMIGLTVSALSGVPSEVRDTAISLGATRLQTMSVVLREARHGVATGVLMGFGRAVSEVGVALMVGGNIRGFTRTLTTAMSLETSMGNIEFSMALGLILMSLAFTVSLVAYRLQQR